jgi:hypothetical protein
MVSSALQDRREAANTLPGAAMRVKAREGRGTSCEPTADVGSAVWARPGADRDFEVKAWAQRRKSGTVPTVRVHARRPAAAHGRRGVRCEIG